MRPCTCNQRNLYWQTDQKDVLPWECGARLYLLACVIHPQCHIIDPSTVISFNPIDCTTTTWHKKRGVIVKMDLPLFLLCCITPQDKNDAWSLLRNSPYCSICETLPPFPGMRVRLVVPHCEIIKITLCHYMHQISPIHLLCLQIHYCKNKQHLQPCISAIHKLFLCYEIKIDK